MATAPSLPFLRAQVTRTRDALAHLDEFVWAWNVYGTLLRAIVETMQGKAPVEMDEPTRIRFKAAEEERKRVMSLGPTKFDSAYFAQTDIQPLVHANLRTEPEKLLLELVENTARGSVVTANAFEAKWGAAEALIERKRHALEVELQGREAIVAERERELAERVPVAAPEVTLKALLRKWRKSVRRFLVSAFVEHLKLTIGGVMFAVLLVVFFWLVPGARRVIPWWHRVADSAQAAPPPSLPHH